MNVVVRQEVLAEGLQVVQRTSVSRSPMQVLTGILFEARDGVLNLAASDLETSVRLGIPATVGQEGSLVLPARIIVELSKRAPAGDITIDSGGDRARATVRFGTSSFTIHGFPKEQFPALPTEIGANGQEIPGEAIRDAVLSTAFAVSTSDMRPILTGVNLRWSESHFHAIATDGFRVAHFRGPGIPSSDDGVEVVLPGRAALELARLSGPDGDALKIAMAENHLLACAGNMLFQSSVLSGQFPAVLEMMPTEYPTVATCDLASLLDACERVALIASAPDRSNAVRLRLGDGQIAITAEAADVGDAEELVHVNVDGQPLEVAFNARYLLDGLKHLNGENARLSFSGPVGAARFTAEDERFEYWVLPLRIS